MERITSITKRDIFELFTKGLEINEFWDLKIVTYLYYGRLSEIDFLKRLYRLEQMPSFDSRFKNAEEDIWQHTVNNNDYLDYWIFEDERFTLKKGSDEDFLNFLCEVFHPEVRNDEGYWEEYLKKINILIKADRYELYECCKISNRSVYSWRSLTLEESRSNKFIPFSIRYKDDIKAKKIKFSLSKKIRNDIINIFDKFDDQFYTTIDNFNYNTTTKEDIIMKIREFYEPKLFNSSNKDLEIANINNFIINEISYRVFDAIELFEKKNIANGFSEEVSQVLKIKNENFKLLGGKIVIDRSERNTTPFIPLAEDLKEKFSSEYINKQFDIMIGEQKNNPTEAIGKAKELIESCCKTILENRSIEVDKNWDIVKLVGETTKLLKVTPNDMPETASEIVSIKAILGNLKAIASNVANLRNSYGSGHGKSASYVGLEERHAKLAIGSSITLVHFLWDSHERQLL